MCDPAINLRNVAEKSLGQQICRVVGRLITETIRRLPENVRNDLFEPYFEILNALRAHHAAAVCSSLVRHARRWMKAHLPYDLVGEDAPAAVKGERHEYRFYSFAFVLNGSVLRGRRRRQGLLPRPRRCRRLRYLTANFNDH